MSEQTDLFGLAAARPAEVKPVKRAPLKERMLERFKSHKYMSFPLEKIYAAYPEHKHDLVLRTLMKLINEREVKAVPAEPGKSILYTLTIYKA